jgi:hypothetical protein
MQPQKLCLIAQEKSRQLTPGILRRLNKKLDLKELTTTQIISLCTNLDPQK